MRVTKPLVLLAVLAGIGLGIGGYTLLYAEGLSYLSDDPEVCINRHIMQPQYDSWQKSSHHAVAVCVDCLCRTTLSASTLQRPTTAGITPRAPRCRIFTRRS